MKCTYGGCREVAFSEGRVWSESDTRRARNKGWFIYDKSAPARFLGQEIAGMALCPVHAATDRGKRLEALHNESLKATEAAHEH